MCPPVCKSSRRRGEPPARVSLARPGVCQAAASVSSGDRSLSRIVPESPTASGAVRGTPVAAIRRPERGRCQCSRPFADGAGKRGLGKLVFRCEGGGGAGDPGKCPWRQLSAPRWLSSGAESVLPGRWAWAGVGPVPKSSAESMLPGRWAWAGMGSVPTVPKSSGRSSLNAFCTWLAKGRGDLPSAQFQRS